MVLYSGLVLKVLLTTVNSKKTLQQDVVEQFTFREVMLETAQILHSVSVNLQTILPEPTGVLLTGMKVPITVMYSIPHLKTTQLTPMVVRYTGEAMTVKS